MSQRITRTAQAQTPVAQLSWQQVRAWRLQKHYLDRRQPRPAMLAVVGTICGLHAQLMSSAELSLWTRLEDISPEHIRQALWEERVLVKTWAMRGTLHLLPSAEFGMWHSALSSFRDYTSSGWMSYLGPEFKSMGQVVEAIAQALDGRLLTRQELSAEVARLTGSADLGAKLLESWGTLLKPAAFEGELCFAPGQGQTVRFTRPRSWLPAKPAPVEPALAALEIVRRYLGAYAPATRADLSRWLACRPPRVTTLLKKLEDEISLVEVEHTLAWMLTTDLAGMAGATLPGTVRLLPAFDPYIIGSTGHVEHLLPGPYKSRIHRQQGWVSPVLLVDGRPEGVWRHERKGNRLLVEIEPFGEVPGWARQAAEAEARRLTAFTGGTLELSWKPLL